MICHFCGHFQSKSEDGFKHHLVTAHGQRVEGIGYVRMETHVKNDLISTMERRLGIQNFFDHKTDLLGAG